MEGISVFTRLEGGDVGGDVISVPVVMVRNVEVLYSCMTWMRNSGRVQESIEGDATRRAKTLKQLKWPGLGLRLLRVTTRYKDLVRQASKQITSFHCHSDT